MLAYRLYTVPCTVGVVDSYIKFSQTEDRQNDTVHFKITLYRTVNLHCKRNIFLEKGHQGLKKIRPKILTITLKSAKRIVKNIFKVCDRGGRIL